MINDDEEEDSTMKQYDTAPGGSKYRPEFLQHFDKKEKPSSSPKAVSTTNEEEKKNEATLWAEQQLIPQQQQPDVVESNAVAKPAIESPTSSHDLSNFSKQNLQRQLQQIAGKIIFIIIFKA